MLQASLFSCYLASFSLHPYLRTVLALTCTEGTEVQGLQRGHCLVPQHAGFSHKAQKCFQSTIIEDFHVGMGQQRTGLLFLVLCQGKSQPPGRSSPHPPLSPQPATSRARVPRGVTGRSAG